MQCRNFASWRLSIADESGGPAIELKSRSLTVFSPISRLSDCGKIGWARCRFRCHAFFVARTAAVEDPTRAGASLTVGGELNKLASNIALGRNTTGLHYRSDGVPGDQSG